MSSPRARLLWLAGICMVVLVLAIHVVTIDRPATWDDEVFVVSTGLSMARSQPPILSTNEQFPGSDSPIKFYGPVSFETSALLIRAFGLSAAAWRLVCFAGVVLTVLVSIGLVGVAGGGQWAQWIAALVLALAGSIATRAPGRWDFVTTGLLLCGLLFLLRGTGLGGRALLLRVVVAGGFVGLALGSTPRALTLCVAAFLSILLTALFFAKERKSLLLALLGISIVAPIVQTLLLLHWGLNSSSWYAYVRAATKQDALDATPMVGRGSWDLHLGIHKTFPLVVLMLFAVALCGAVAHLRSDSSGWYSHSTVSIPRDLQAVGSRIDFSGEASLCR